MVAENYFVNFPIITYANTQCINLTKRAKLIHTKRVDPDAYYPIEIDDTIRADQLANKAYGDSYLDWLIYLNNYILDPYYGYHLSTTNGDFQAHLIDAYGSPEFAQQSVIYWRTQWPSQYTSISVSAYDALPFAWTKYYIPVYAPNNAILEYQQAFLDWRVNTNQLVSFNITDMSGANSFATGNVVSVMVGGNPNGQFQVIEANSTYVLAQHIQGNCSFGGFQDAFNANVTAVMTSSNTISINIPVSEAVFWEPLTYYDWEDENNTLNKYMNLLNPAVTMQLTAQISKDVANNS